MQIRCIICKKQTEIDDDQFQSIVYTMNEMNLDGVEVLPEDIDMVCEECGDRGGLQEGIKQVVEKHFFNNAHNN